MLIIVWALSWSRTGMVCRDRAVEEGMVMAKLLYT